MQAGKGLAGEQSAFGFRLVAVNPVEIGRGQLVMGLNRQAMLRLLGEPELRLGPAQDIPALRATFNPS